MADSVGPSYPGLGATIDRSGTNWGSPTNIQALALRATATIPAISSSDWLRGTNFGFSVPGGATIDGIKLEISRYGSALDTIADTDVYLLDADGNPTGDDQALPGYWPTSQATATYGGAADKWGASLTPAMVNDPDFGVRMYVTNMDFEVSRSAYVYWYKITVYYTEAGTAKKSSFFQML